ncbi:MAG: hypothetical protein WBB37_03350 [bacterium]
MKRHSRCVVAVILLLLKPGFAVFFRKDNAINQIMDLGKFRGGKGETKKLVGFTDIVVIMHNAAVWIGS